MIARREARYFIDSNIVNRENRRHWGPAYSDMSADPLTYLSKNHPLAELRHAPLRSINRLESPTKLVLNRAFQLDINKIARLAASDHAAPQPLPLAEKTFWPDGRREGKKMSVHHDLRSRKVRKMTTEGHGT